MDLWRVLLPQSFQTASIVAHIIKKVKCKLGKLAYLVKVIKFTVFYRGRMVELTTIFGAFWRRIVVDFNWYFGYVLFYNISIFMMIMVKEKPPQ